MRLFSMSVEDREGAVLPFCGNWGNADHTMKVYGFAEPLSDLGQVSPKTGFLEEEPAGQ